MRAVDAPAAGWYPDPENRARLRWWDGLDWTDIRRAVPSNAELTRAEYLIEQPQAPVPQHDYLQHQQQAMRGVDSQQLINEVRVAAREEINRAADDFSRRAERAVRNVQPLISQYTNRILKWVRIAVIAAVILLVAWFVFQVILQASVFEWIGDRIDNLTNNDGG